MRETDADKDRKKLKNYKEKKRGVKTVARQHTTSVEIQQRIQFLRFLSPRLL